MHARWRNYWKRCKDKLNFKFSRVWKKLISDIKLIVQGNLWKIYFVWKLRKQFVFVSQHKCTLHLRQYFCTLLMHSGNLHLALFVEIAGKWPTASPLVLVFGMGFVGFALFFLALKALSTEVLGLPSVSAHNACYSFIHSWPMQPCVREFGQWHVA